MATVPATPADLRTYLVRSLLSTHTLGLMVIFAAIVALVVGGWLWSQTPDYRVLYASVAERDAGAIVTALQQMNVPYKFADGANAVMVPANRVHEARLRLASQGLPKGGLAGFELMENQKLGTSQFLEQVNYQRALEGELARSIQSLSAVRAARVHLAIPKATVFLREQQKPSASVLLNLFAGRSLEPAQVSAIAHMVASSVPDLPVANVTVVDQTGTLLSQRGDAGRNPALDPAQLKYVREIEQAVIRRIESILAPIVGQGNVRAQVSADVDFSVTEQAAESYKPNQNDAAAAVRSRQSTESGSSQPGAGGVPGALSNQPPGEGAPAAQAAGTAGSSRRDATVNYEVDKSVSYVRGQTGVIRRLTVAVVVNHRKEDASAKAAPKPLPEKELEQMRELVKEAVGFDEKRGDRVNVVNSPFVAPEREIVPDVPFWKSPSTWEAAQDIGKHLLIAAIVLFLVLRVLRPMITSLLESRRAEQEAAQVIESGVLRPPSYEDNLTMVRQLARQEPKVVANVVREWVSGNE